MILVSNDRTSASKKINGMTLIRILTVSTTAFERRKEKFYRFRQTVFTELSIWLSVSLSCLENGLINKILPIVSTLLVLCLSKEIYILKCILINRHAVSYSVVSYM